MRKVRQPFRRRRGEDFHGSRLKRSRQRSEPVEDKPPGTIHVAVHDGTAAQNLSYTINLGRPANKRRAVTSALFLLRRALLASR